MTETVSSRDAIAMLRATNEKAAELACAVSLASRIEPELLRSARLTLVAGADVAAEADVWSSAIMQSRTALFAVMRPEVAHELRTELAGNKPLLAAAWGVVDRIHREAPPSVRVEEEITWRTLANPDDAEIDRLFASVLAGLKDSRLGLARWVARALPRMPPQARELGSAVRVALRAGSLLGGRPILHETASRIPLAEIATDIVADVASVKIGLRLFEASLRVSEPPELHTQTIEIPLTEPLVLELSGQADGVVERRLISFARASTHTASIAPGIVAISTAAGDQYTLTPLASRQLSGHTAVASEGGLTLRAYRGANKVLLAFDVDHALAKNLLGFSLSRLGPHGTISALGTGASEQPPLQRFHWVDTTTSGAHTYYLTTLTGSLDQPRNDGPTVNVDIDVESSWRNITVGFTNPAEPESDELPRIISGRSRTELDDSAPVPPLSNEEIRARGGAAWATIGAFLDECLHDEYAELDVLMPYWDEQLLLQKLLRLGPRARLVVDRRRQQHQATIEQLERARCRIEYAETSQQLHNARVMVRSRLGRPESTLVLSMHISAASLYGRENYVIRVDDPELAAAHHRLVSSAARYRAMTFEPLEIRSTAIPDTTLLLSPSRQIIQHVRRRLGSARSSIVFCLPDETSEELIETLRTVGDKGRPFIAGLLHSPRGLGVVWGPGGEEVRVAGDGRTFTRGNFIAIDFNEPTAALIAGSLTFTDTSVKSLGNLLEIRDPAIATVFAIEGISIIDAVRRRAALQRTDTGRLALDRTPSWTRRYYTGLGAIERTLLAATPRSQATTKSTARRKQQPEQQRKSPPVRKAAAKKVTPRRKRVVK